MAVHIHLDPASGSSVLELWTQASSASDVAFSEPAGVTDDEVTWEVTLPADQAVTAAALRSAHADLDATARALEEVRAQVALWGTEPPWGDTDVAFGADAGTLGGPDDADAAVGLDRLARAAAPIAWVETRVGGQLVARSRTTLGGATSAVVLDGGLRHLVRHQQALELATRSRLMALETVATVLRATLAVAARLGLPGGPLLTLPLVWRLVRRLVDTSTRRR
jgi:hypothetical protein